MHVWSAELSAIQGALGPLRALLEPGETERAARFRFERDASRFVLCRGILRVLLGRYLGRPPDRIRFGYSSHGKPFVMEDPAGGSLQFNLSHSEEVALVAVAAQRRVGVDIERIRPDASEDAIALRFFSAEEVAALRAVPAADRAEAFFSCWTRKEAYVKARGEGLSIPLKSFSVSLAPRKPAALLRCDSDPEEVSRWSIRDLAPAADYAGAVAAEGQIAQIRRWLLPPDLLRVL